MISKCRDKGRKEGAGSHGEFFVLPSPLPPHQWVAARRLQVLSMHSLSCREVLLLENVGSRHSTQ